VVETRCAEKLGGDLKDKSLDQSIVYLFYHCKFIINCGTGHVKECSI
jgi:hypothetical protein